MDTGRAVISKTQHTLNPFAMFVKENYGVIKKETESLSHKEIMNVLSQRFVEKNRMQSTPCKIVNALSKEFEKSKI